MGVIITKSAPEVEKLSSGRTRQWLAHKQSGTTSTALIENYFEEEGFVPPHYHRTEELLVCLEGHGLLIIDNEPYEFPAGSTAVIPPLAVHEVQNKGKGTMRMLGFFPDAAPESVWMNNNEEQPLKPAP